MPHLTAFKFYSIRSPAHRLWRYGCRSIAEVKATNVTKKSKVRSLKEVIAREAEAQTSSLRYLASYKHTVLLVRTAQNMPITDMANPLMVYKNRCLLHPRRSCNKKDDLNTIALELIYSVFESELTYLGRQSKDSSWHQAIPTVMIPASTKDN